MNNQSKSRYRRIAIFVVALTIAAGSVNVFAQSAPNDPQADDLTQKAPELEGAKGWLNTDKPLSIAGLKGKIVLLDFWTYGCVNCIHIIPDLKYLEAKYENELVVIGVHSAKFKNEAEEKNIRQIILRYGIEHPVVNDADYRIWRAYGIRAWPTQVLIDPDGNLLGGVSGEGHRELLDEAIGKLVETYKKNGRLDQKPRPLALERSKIGSLPLAFPGKVFADSVGKRLFIADSSHNRIVITNLKGKVIDVIGTGDPSFVDGDFAKAGFRKPQGMTLDGDFLYVADTENHSIRKVDLKKKTVSTIAGTGTLRGFNGFGGAGLSTALRSPWDLEKAGKFLYVAMAGSHQIWRLDLTSNKITPYAGDRQESRKDGPIKLSNFAQPSGIVSDGSTLFVADSESNIIRAIDLEKEEVDTIVGGDLFEFGDVDGVGDDVRLQHPLGIETYKGNLLIADTYNHKIKLLETKANTVTTLFGTGEEGQLDGNVASFYEPGGISLGGKLLYVADTNNHAIRVIDLENRSVSTLAISGLKPPVSGTIVPEIFPNQIEYSIGPQTIAISKSNSLSFEVELPEGYHLNPNAPQRFEVSFGANKSIKMTAEKGVFKKLPLTIPFETTKAETVDFAARLNIYYCRKDNTGVCYIKSVSWKGPVKFVKQSSAKDNLTLKAKIELAN